ncbi:MAG: hypothetical protein EI684_00250 [Candidatus Viridilinea halotolerans]|uniref:Tetratricopeptide repeat protein n=1 Tax=Candidatus Viridilinea halotolerans TaxID=2491704 RepID=A0A426UC58_9CHLR|nr:MAG: hypothetical protein EI684_00250 [Candidatus Viridilinea halotolerans]
MVGQVFLICVLWLLGYADQALACSQQLLARVRSLEYALILQFALTMGEVGVRYLRREPQAMQAAFEQLTALGTTANPAVACRGLRLLQ